jgi:hypothetical protein
VARKAPALESPPAGDVDIKNQAAELSTKIAGAVRDKYRSLGGGLAQEQTRRNLQAMLEETLTNNIILQVWPFWPSLSFAG